MCVHVFILQHGVKKPKTKTLTKPYTTNPKPETPAWLRQAVELG
jgi:hypothetical protein